MRQKTFKAQAKELKETHQAQVKDLKGTLKDKEGDIEELRLTKSRLLAELSRVVGEKVDLQYRLDKVEQRKSALEYALVLAQVEIRALADRHIVAQDKQNQVQRVVNAALLGHGSDDVRLAT